MSFSPALAHRQRVLAELSAKAQYAELTAGLAPAMPEAGPVATEYQTLLIRLHEDLRRLSEVQSRDKKIALKAELIGTYRPWVEAVIAAAAAAHEAGEPVQAPQDEIVVTVFVWSLDIRDWELALSAGGHIIQHGLQLPERFKRTAGGVLVSEIADAAINEPGSVPHETLLMPIGDGPAWDMKNETLARLHRAIGESWARQAEAFDPNAESAPAGGKAMLIDAALTSLREALRLDAKVGVKEAVRNLERDARKLAPPETAKE